MSQEANPDIKELLAQLKQTQLAYQMASEISQFKGGFLARTSHELRSPLNSLIGLLQLILSGLCDDPAEEREFIGQAHTSALKLVKLLDEIIAVAKTQHGTSKLDIQPLQLKEVLEEAYDLTHLQAANRNLQLQVSSPDPDIYVLADPHWLQHVFVNLIDTAITLMEEGSIQVSVPPLGETGYACVWIDAECSPSIWSEPRDLLESAPTPEEAANQARETPTGTPPKLSAGLTLLTNQNLMEVMGGRLEVVSPEASGKASPQNLTRFQYTIPLTPPENV